MARTVQRPYMYLFQLGEIREIYHSMSEWYDAYTNRIGLFIPQSRKDIEKRLKNHDSWTVETEDDMLWELHRVPMNLCLTSISYNEAIIDTIKVINAHSATGTHQSMQLFVNMVPEHTRVDIIKELNALKRKT